jgi:hypothetical protein
LSAAVWVALQPHRLDDLHLVRTWLAYVWQHSADPYAHFALELDYPPVALLLLAPLGWIPAATLSAWFLPLSILVTAAAAWVLVGAVAERVYIELTAPQRVAMVAMIMSGSSVRGAIWRGQTVALAVLFGALALSWSQRRPWAAALMLALCSFKPHLAVGFGLAIILVDGIGVVLTALVIVTAATWVFAAAVNQPVLAIVASYARNLLTMYNGPDRVTGMLSVRWVLDEIVGRYDVSTLLYGVAACFTLVLIGVAARRATDAASRAQVLAVALLWPLLFLPSQLYNALLAWPAVWLLMWPEGGFSIREPRRIAYVTAYVLFGVLDLPRLLRFSAERIDNAYWLFKGSYYLHPVRLSMMFAFLLFVAFRRGRADQTELPF